MSINLMIYISTKNTDLHAVSAFEALHHIMGFETLKSLRRFRVLNVLFDCETKEEAKSYLSHMVTNSFDLMNPNKEAYCIEKLKDKPSNLQVTLVDVRAKRQTGDEERLVNYFRERHGIPLMQIESGIVWELGIDSSEQQDSEAILDHYVWSTSMTQGLLAHPIQDAVRLLDSSDVYV